MQVHVPAHLLVFSPGAWDQSVNMRVTDFLRPHVSSDSPCITGSYMNASMVNTQ